MPDDDYIIEVGHRNYPGYYTTEHCPGIFAFRSQDIYTIVFYFNTW